MSHPSIVLENVTLQFPRRKPKGGIGGLLRGLLRLRAEGGHSFTALDDVSLEIYEGEVVGVIGSNGAGKSTLLRVMSGVYRPNHGTARVAGHVTLLGGLGAGFNGHLTGRENAYLYGSILGHSRELMDELLDSIVEFADLGDFIDQPLRTYSSGMRARLGFSVATAVQPEVLLIDEVFAVGDIDFKERSRARIREVVDTAGTVVIVSHNFQLLSQVCTRMLLVEKGKIQTGGSPAEVIETYRGRHRRSESTTKRRAEDRPEEKAAG